MTCEDFRSRDNWWNQSRYCLDFFAANAVPFWNMTNRDSVLTGASGSPLLCDHWNVYVAHLPTPTSPTLNLAGLVGTFRVRWFDPRHGGNMQTGTVPEVSGGASVSLGNPPGTSTNDWVVLVRMVDQTAPNVSIQTPQAGANVPGNTPLIVQSDVTDASGVRRVELWIDDVFRPPALISSPYHFEMWALPLGAHTLAVVGEDTSDNRGTNQITINVITPTEPVLSLVSTGGVLQLVWDASGFSMQQAIKVEGPWNEPGALPLSPLVIHPQGAQSFFRLNWVSP